MTARGLLARITGPTPPDFALLHRVHRAGRMNHMNHVHRGGAAGGGDRVDVLVGTTAEAETVAGIPLPPPGGRDRHEVLALLPYRQIRERGYDHPDDGAPLLAMTVTGQAVLTREETLAALPDGPLALRGGGFDLDDERYAAIVRRIVDEEIGRGNGANFVIKRSFVAEIADWSAATALVFFRRLLAGESGAYWTFVVRAGGRTFVGASPERHVSLDRGTVVMNPVSGTYRYPPQGPTPVGVLEFLSDAKEANELYMVLDEELKMTGRLCEGGGRAAGPYLKEMGRVAHTEYLIEGRSRLDAREILAGTLFAPTVTGSPLESACRVISRYEPEGRGYYAGALALFGRDADGGQALDSAILIRTADVDAAGRMTLSVGSTLVRDSDPDAEAAETRAKAAGLLAALRGEGLGGSGGAGAGDGPDVRRALGNRPAPAGHSALANGPGARPTLGNGLAPAPAPRPLLADHPDVRRALAERNTLLADFWLADPVARVAPRPGLTGREVLLIDAEDHFTDMARHLLASHGLRVSVRRFDDEYRLDGHDLVAVGPGPGDPRDLAHPKIRHLRGVVRRLLASGRPFFAVCLGHQVLSTVLGLDVVRREVPHQGVQRKIEAFGRTELVGFYNTFAATCPTDSFPCPVRGGTVHVSRDPENDEVHALRGPGFASVQFHPASVLTRNGVELLGAVVSELMTSPAPHTT